MRCIDKQTLIEVHNVYDDLILGNNELALKQLGKILNNKQLNLHVVVKSLKDRKTTTIEDYIKLFYDKQGDKYFSKGTCLFRNMEEIKQRYNWFLRRTL